MKSKLSNIPNLSDVDIENNLVNAINSDYYEQDSFKYSFSNWEKTFSLFHMNTRRLPQAMKTLSSAAQSCFS